MPKLQSAIEDLKDAIGSREVWFYLAHQEIRQRYVRSILGPFWITITNAVLIAGIGVLYGGLFGNPLAVYIPYIGISLIMWSLIQTTITDGCSMYINSGGILKQAKLPKLMFLFKLLYRNMIIFAHNLIIIIVVLVIFPQQLDWTLLLWPLLFLLLLANIGAAAFIAAIISARYRDIPPIVASALQILFFVTPIIWRAKDLPDRLTFLSWNPFFHLLELCRAPLLGEPFPMQSLLICIAMAVFGWAVAFTLFTYKRRSIVYWI